MAKALLMSVMFMTLIVPIRFSKERNAARGLRKTVTFMGAYIVFWTLGCVYLYAKLQ